MKYKIKIAERTFEVEIHDLQRRPILAIVDGEAIEVWPQDEIYMGLPKSPPPPGKRGIAIPGYPGANRVPAGETPSGLGAGALLSAPLPGTILSIMVQPGDEVTIGQELIILEAMKMKNIIRSPRAGQIAFVHILPGQSVKHYDKLLEFID